VAAVVLPATITLLLAAPGVPARGLASGEHVLFVPGTARCLDGHRLAVRIEAWVFERERRPGLSSAFSAYLGLHFDALPPAARELFEARTQLFRVDSQRHRTLDLDVGGTRVVLPTTNAAGRASSEANVASMLSCSGWIEFSLAASAVPAHADVGRALLVPDTGVSVVSDIDDTIKDSKVRLRRELLLNTFVREFRAVEGMPARYRALAGELPAVAFHYVSAGPIQLAEPLQAFIDEAGFPAGSLHLRESTAWSHVFAGRQATRAHKLAAISRILADFPRRQFVLVGDSAEADPEVYGEIARRHARQVIAIRIRNLGAETLAGPRMGAAFAGLPAGLATLYDDADPVPLAWPPAAP
jgi:hypothetical protein